MELQDKGLTYLYCLTNKVPKLKEIEVVINCMEFQKAPFRALSKRMLDSSRKAALIYNIYFIFHQGLYAVTGRVSTDEFSEENLKKNLSNLEWITAKASAHEKVIEIVMQNSCVIPFKFGTLFNTEENLKTMLNDHMREFKDTLKYLEGKEEWGVKIYCDIDKLKENLIREDKELLNIDKEINSASPGKGFILKKKKEELISSIINKKLNEYGKASFERLKQHSVEFRINKLLPKEVTERKEEMILNSAFLIKKNKVENFMETENALKEIFEEMGFFLDCTGPWPSYNFISLKEK